MKLVDKWLINHQVIQQTNPDLSQFSELMKHTSSKQPPIGPTD